MVSHDLTVIGVVINELKWVLYIEKKGGGALIFQLSRD